MSENLVTFVVDGKVTPFLGQSWQFATYRGGVCLPVEVFGDRITLTVNGALQNRA